MEKENVSLHVVMFPWFAYGHIIPFIQLSNKLSCLGVRITFLSASGNITRTLSSLHLGPHVQIISLQIPSIEGLPPGLENTADMTPDMAEILKLALDQMKPQIETLLTQLKPQFVIHDFAHYWLPSLASQLDIKTLFFSVFSPFIFAFFIIPSRVNPTIEDLKYPPLGFPTLISFTSLKTFQACNCSYLYTSFHGAPSAYDRCFQCLRDCTAILFKSCHQIEGPFIDFMKTQYKKPVFTIGPLVAGQLSGELDQRWAKWLSSFGSKSVIFCSFGSETFLEDEQIKELVLGLESTGLPFMVILNFPATGDSKLRLKSALPDGFEERVKDKGLVHTGWVQQQRILAHDSVGCYVFHSGISSIIEGLVNDCQLVLLPLKGDQFLNSTFLCEEMKAAVEVNRRDEDGYFGKDDLCLAVKTVMVDVNEEPGKSIRANHRKWKEFMLDSEIQNGFIEDFVKELKEMAC